MSVTIDYNTLNPSKPLEEALMEKLYDTKSLEDFNDFFISSLLLQ